MSRGQGLLEDHVDLAGGAVFHDLQVAVVLNEGPHHVGLLQFDHPLVIGEGLSVGDALFGFSDQLGVRLGDADQVGVRQLGHPGDAVPGVGMHQPHDAQPGLFGELGVEQERAE